MIRTFFRDEEKGIYSIKVTGKSENLTKTAKDKEVRYNTQKSLNYNAGIGD